MQLRPDASLGSYEPLSLARDTKLDEAKSLAALDHPSIAAIHEVSE